MNYFVPPQYFTEDEFVSPDTLAYFRARGSAIWFLFRPQILYAIYKLRERYNRPIYINDGVNYKWRGFRTPLCPEYSAYSQHAMGAALDFVVDGMTAEEVRQDILTHQSADGICCITAIEVLHNGRQPTWVHIDCRNHDRDLNGILLIKA